MKTTSLAHPACTILHVCTQDERADKAFFHSKLGKRKCYFRLAFAQPAAPTPLPPTPCTHEKRGVENIIRERGAVPATVAILKGRPHVGLSASQLESLAEAGPRARKCSRRDLAVAMAQVCTYIYVCLLCRWQKLATIAVRSNTKVSTPDRV